MNISEKQRFFITASIAFFSGIAALLLVMNYDFNKNTKMLNADIEISKALNYKIHEIIKKPSNEISRFQKPSNTNIFGGEIKISNDDKNNIILLYSAIPGSEICKGILFMQNSTWYSVNGFVLSDTKQIKENMQKICPADSESISLTLQY